ncbi:MAG: UDP-N-acetylmuramate--L-alanine ligase [Candidatus Omnitrophota bacterium]
MSKHFHFVGIGGIGMGAIASLLLAKGHRVSGSDVKENKITHDLKEKGAVIFIGHQADHVGDADVVIYSSAVKSDNPEIKIAKQKKITLFQRAQMLANLASGQKCITVAGAHGKTTTTSMISHLLIKAGLEPTTAVGGIIQGQTYAASLGKGHYFVAEVDESDGSFLNFSPYYSVITNIDREHLDYYGTFEKLLKAYRKFIDQTNFDGRIFTYAGDPYLAQLLKESKREYTSYDLSEEADVYAKDISVDGFTSRFRCIYHQKDIGFVTLRVPGHHNILNALACICLGMALHIDFDVINMSLNKYEGVQRRFQLKADTQGILVVDDYGHHPTEIQATLKAARSFGRKRLIVAFQPHRYSRTKLLLNDFIEPLCLSDHLIITDIYAASEKPIPGVSAKVLYEKIKKLNRMPVEYIRKELITDHLFNMAREGDLILTLGAGDINQISDQLAEKFNQVYAPKT